MKIYLVGGAVRDQLLGLTVKERDWVVVGGTSKEMTDLGYQSVGKGFPVFLHPKTREEYALARIERKVGRGYTGFECESQANVRLEDDLKRRDLTINALAQDDNGRIIDPYGGQEDLRKKQLRHVSPAFVEDPLRVLRVARFAARYYHLGFKVANETLQLMRAMVRSGEINELVKERVWLELTKALSEKHPEVFFHTLRQCGALSILFPELNALFGVPASSKGHPEIDTGVHTLMVLQQATLLTDDLVVRFASLTHDLGKGSTPFREWPTHRGHEKRGVELIRKLATRYALPKHYQTIAELAAEFHGIMHHVDELEPNTQLEVLERLDAFRRPERLSQVCLVCEADYKGRMGYEKKSYPHSTKWQQILECAQSIDVQTVIAQGYKGADIAKQLRECRLLAITNNTNPN